MINPARRDDQPGLPVRGQVVQHAVRLVQKMNGAGLDAKNGKGGVGLAPPDVSDLGQRKPAGGPVWEALPSVMKTT